MKVEIMDRALWLRHVEDAIKRIEDYRAELNAMYEKEWAERYDRRGWLRYVIGPWERTPPQDTWNTHYPSRYAWKTLHDLRTIKSALQTKGTNAVYLTGEEIRAIL